MSRVLELAVALEERMCIRLGLAACNPNDAARHEAAAAEIRATLDRLRGALSTSLGKPVTFAFAHPVGLHEKTSARALSGDDPMDERSFEAIDVRQLCDDVAVPDEVMRSLGWWRCREGEYGLLLHAPCGEPEVRPGVCAAHLPGAIEREREALTAAGARRAEAEALVAKHAARLRELLGEGAEQA